jgi:hypothetical protein
MVANRRLVVVGFYRYLRNPSVPVDSPLQLEMLRGY